MIEKAVLVIETRCDCIYTGGKRGSEADRINFGDQMGAETTRTDFVGRVEGMGHVYISGGGRSAISSSFSVARRRRQTQKGRGRGCVGEDMGRERWRGLLNSLNVAMLHARSSTEQNRAPPRENGGLGTAHPPSSSFFSLQSSPRPGWHTSKQEAASSKQNSMQQPQVAFGTATVPGRGSMALAPGYATPGGCPQQCRYRPRYIVRYKLWYMQPYNGTSIWHGPRGRLTSVKY